MGISYVHHANFTHRLFFVVGSLTAMSGCSMFRVADRTPAQPEATAVAAAPAPADPPPTQNDTQAAHTTSSTRSAVTIGHSTPSVSAYSLAESLENYPRRSARAVNDPIVSNSAGIPASSTPTGNAAEDMALDTMDSLAQVTFASQGSDFDPDVSRDAEYIVYASTQHRPTADIYLKAVNGRTITQLTADPGQDVMPVLSPDGSRVAFASNRSGSWDVYVMSVNGGQAVQVTSDPAHELHPSWSPDGSRLVFCRLGEVSGRWEMWVADVDQPMAGEFIGYGLFPSWCPVASTAPGKRDKILFQRSRERGDRAFSVWTVDYKSGDASSPTEIVSSATSAAINPAWSADGTRIVYATVPYAAGINLDRPSASDLWMCGVDGSGRVNLTTGRSVNLMPKWSSDGRIYFVSDRGGIDNIWSVGTDKAIMAATGKMPTPNTAMKKHKSEPAHAVVPAAEHETAEVPTADEPEHP